MNRSWHRRKIFLLLIAGLLALSSTAFAEEESGSESFWSKTKVTGQFNTSYNFNFNNPPLGVGNTLRVFDTAHNDFDFNLAEISIENSPAEWVKFRLDLNYGEDVVGNDILKGGVIGVDEFGVQEAYAALTAPVGNGLTFKVGHFVTMIGYEVLESAYNLNTSRSLLFGFAIPFTHTGLLVSYPFNDRWSGSFGIVNGWDLVGDNNKGKTFLGQVTYAPNEDVTLSLQGAFGPEQGASDRNFRGLIDFVANWQVNEQWLLGLNYDWGKEDGIGGRGFTNWMGGALYVHYKPVDVFGLTLRGEFFDDDGSRTGFSDLTYAEATLTSHFYLADGWETRLEFRHDHADRGIFTKSNGGTRKFQDTIGAEVVYSF